MARRREAALRGLVTPLCGVVAGTLVWAGLSLPDRRAELAERVQREIPATGVSNPVTAVLLDFRGYDTLLEIAVLVLALTAVGALGRTAPRHGPRDASPARPALPAGPLLGALARTTAPAAILVAGYLWWAGSHAPGGAFQGGAVLGAGGVLLILAGKLDAARLRAAPARAGAAAGLLAFVAVAVVELAAGRTFLDHPPAHAGAVIVCLEGVLTLSIATVLAGLFAAGHAR